MTSAELVSVATMTRATADSGELLLESMRCLSCAGLSVAVTDAGSPGGFVEALRRLRGIDVQVLERGTLSDQIVASVTRAALRQTARVLYTEPDKLLFFTDHLPAFLGRVRNGPEAAVTLAARSRESFATFPSTQRLAEQSLNALCGSITGFGTDYCYGPFVLSRDLVRDVTAMPGSLGWGWRPYLFASASRRGMPIAAVTGDYVCPVADREERADDRIHRMRQLAQNVMGLVQAAERTL